MKKLLVIEGPTATGKTNLAVGFAKEFGGEIVSADSRQIYKGMDIGTGKIDVGAKTLDVRKKEGKWLDNDTPIHLYDIFTPEKTFSVAEYQQLAYKKIKDIQARGKLPILVGGTGLYIRAVVQGLKVPQVEPDKKFRLKSEKKPLSQLLAELEAVDPKSFMKIDKSNPRRVIRALEIFHKTGKPASELAKKYKPDFNILQIGLTAGKEILYEKTDKRVDTWVNNGFVDEVKDLLKKYDRNLTSMSSLGYRQISSYLDKKVSLEEAVKRMKFDHHGYIRRQFTWFKKEHGVIWLDITDKKFSEKAKSLVSKWINETS